MLQTYKIMKGKQLNEQLISIIVGLSFGIVGAILSFRFPEHITIMDSIYIGIFSYIVTILAFLESRLRVLDSLNRIDNNMTYVSNYLLSEEKAISKGNDSFGIYWALCIARAKEGIYKLIDSNTFVVEEHQVPNFWQQAIINTDISWFCTTYSNTPDDFEGWSKWGFELQGMGIKRIGTVIKRVFIVDDESEITEEFIDRIKWHQSQGVMVKWISREISLKWVQFKEFEKLIGTIDIAIINGNYLLAFEIKEDNNRRGISSINCYADRDIVSKINTLLMHLWDNSKEIDSLKIRSNVIKE